MTIRTVRSGFACVAALALALLVAPHASAFPPANYGKRARIETTGDPATNRATFAVGRDPALQSLLAQNPFCFNTSKLEVAAYLQSTARVVVLASVPLACGRWSASGRQWRYDDPLGTVRTIRYGKGGFKVTLGGPGLAPPAEPVVFLQLDLTVENRKASVRFHEFVQNDGTGLRTRRTTRDAALGETGFWSALSGAADAEADQTETIARLTRATRDEANGRSRFLLAMLHLYRFGQRVTRFDEASPEAVDELQAANGWFAEATPLLWSAATGTGDSRVPGFAASALYQLGVVQNDPAVTAAGMAALADAVAVNPFFNVFDYLPVLASRPPSHPDFQTAFAAVTTYLEDPETVSCVNTQPLLCANAGMAPSNMQGSLTLFGDIYAKAGNQAAATQWYQLADLVSGPTYAFDAAVNERVANVATRVALYQDADPANDPPLFGAGAEACAMCHHR
jgi:hypothetical protein